MTKLKQLSIVTLAGKSTTKILIYKDLMTQLDVNAGMLCGLMRICDIICNVMINSSRIRRYDYRMYI